MPSACGRPSRGSASGSVPSWEGRSLRFSWSSVFWVNVPFVLAGFVIAYVAVTESRNPEGRGLDVVGMVAIALGLLGITFGLIESSSHPWAPPTS